MDDPCLDPQLALKEMKCIFCLHHLSVPPIVVVSEDGESLKCGRCKNIKTEICIRNKALETVLKRCKFPCIFEHCRKKLRWGDVQEHERTCPKRTMACPFFRCYDKVVVEDWESHFLKAKHKYGNVVNGEFMRQLFFIKFGVGLMIKNEIPYLIHYGLLSEESMWVSVFSFGTNVNEDIKYEVKFSSPDCQKALLYENQPVIPYNPREHCSRCVFCTYESEECYKPYHIFSKLYGTSRANVCTTTKIDLGDIKKLYYPKPIYYSINVKENLEEPLINNILLRRTLQCPICLRLMSRQIYACNTGHIFCHNCKPLLTACPNCRIGLGNTRSYALEEIAENVQLTCHHRNIGCNFIGNVKKIFQHEAKCTKIH